MTLVTLASRSVDLAPFADTLRGADAGLDVVLWPDPRALEAEVLVGWDVPHDLAPRMPRLKLVHSMAAGVDNVARGIDLNSTALCRVIDPQLAEGMAQYVLWGVLHFHRRMDTVLAQQPFEQWVYPGLQPASEFRVGIMGLGAMGSHVAHRLQALGYSVRGWSRSPHSLPGATLFHGEAGLHPFLAGTDALVCLLPLTDATRAILNAANLQALPRGAALIHVGRGEHLVEDALLQALSSGHLRGALIDVFDPEPLPAGHRFWKTPGVIVTPHMATMNQPHVVVEQVVQNIQRWRLGEALSHQVDGRAGY